MSRLWIAIVVLFVVSCGLAPQETGMLEGHVTIGPSLPASHEGLAEPTPDPRVYASREVVIDSSDGRTEVARAQIDSEGDYCVTLPVGTYVVDIYHAGMDVGVDLPQTVEIVSQKVTRLDIVIDTGVR